jgi:hypothetical protein
MHDILLALHNILRWVVVILGIIVLGRALWGWFGKKAWEKTDRMLGIAFTSAFDIQILLGLLLYFFSSSVGLHAFLTQPIGEVLGNQTSLLFAVEHPVIMILAVVFAHLGSILPKRAKDDPTRYKQAAICFGLALLLTLAAMPWARPLFPGL